MKQELLAERSKILSELDLVDRLLASRYGWEPEAKTPATLKVVAPVAATGKSQTDTESDGGDDEDSIPYAQEATAWLASIHHKKPFSVRDFRKWLAGKYGEAKVNKDSLKGPLRKLEDAKKITVVLKGIGRRPTTYRLP